MERLGHEGTAIAEFLYSTQLRYLHPWMVTRIKEEHKSNPISWSKWHLKIEDEETTIIHIKNMEEDQTLDRNQWIPWSMIDKQRGIERN